MENQDVRWKLRFQNYEKALHQLQCAVEKPILSDLEKAGLIQIYEFTFELAWKTIKDFLENKKIEVSFPRDTIKEAFKYEIISDGDTWMDMLDKSNLMSHTYDEKNAETAYMLITGCYVHSLEMLYERLKTEL